MPAVKDLAEEEIPGAFYAEPGSEEAARLDDRWDNREFIAKVTGNVLIGKTDSPIVLYVPIGHDPSMLSGMFAMMEHDPPISAISGQIVEWRDGP